MRTLRAAPPREEVVFRLERCERVGTRLEIEGRWSHVRGRVFVRPSLTVAAGSRLLAVLDHKPWIAEEDRLWRAAFELEGDDTAANEGGELAVAPDIVVRLPGDGAPPAEHSPLAEALHDRDAAVAERDAAVAERDAAVAERDAAVAERDAAVAERDAALAEVARLRERPTP